MGTIRLGKRTEANSPRIKDFVSLASVAGVSLTVIELTVSPKTIEADTAPSVLPWDAVDRTVALNGVDSAGTLTDLDVGADLVTASPMSEPLRVREPAIAS